MASFQSFWFGERLSPYEELAMKSFIAHGHRYNLFAYDRIEAPAGVVVQDAAEILPRDRIFHYKFGSGAGSVAGFTNLFRYQLLHGRGGWWVDTDVVCLTDEVPPSDICLGWQEDDSIGTAILRLPAGHPFARELRDEAEAAGTDVAWGETGPILMTRLAPKSDVSASILPAAQLYPVRARHALHVLNPERTAAVRESVASACFQHLWNEMFRRAAVLKRIAPPPGSYLAELFARYQVAADPGQGYTAEQIARLEDNFAAALAWKAGKAKLAELQKEAAGLRSGLADVTAERDRLTAQVGRLEDQLRLRAAAAPDASASPSSAAEAKPVETPANLL